MRVFDLGSCSTQFNSIQLQAREENFSVNAPWIRTIIKRYKFPFARVIYELKHNFRIAHTQTQTLCTALLLWSFMLLLFFSKLFTIILLNVHYNIFTFFYHFICIKHSQIHLCTRQCYHASSTWQSIFVHWNGFLFVSFLIYYSLFFSRSP